MASTYASSTPTTTWRRAAPLLVRTVSLRVDGKKLEAGVGRRAFDKPLKTMQRIALTSATVAAGGLVGVFMYPDRTAGECRAWASRWASR